MSVEAFSWALNVPVGGNQKVVLLGLANHAHPDGSESYPSLDTLAKYAHCDRSTARRNVRKLAADGWVQEDGVGPKGQTKYRLAMGAPFKVLMAENEGGGDSPSVASAPSGGGASAAKGVAPMPPEPSLEPSSTDRKEKKARARDQAKQSLPEDFPQELTDHARVVFRLLRQVAREHGAREVYPQAVGLVIAAYPRRPLVETAHALATWAVDPPRPIKDVVSTYRTFLQRERDLASVERLSADGTTGTAAALPEGVTALRPGWAGRRSQPSAADYARMAAELEAQGL